MKLIDADALLDYIDVGHYRNPSELCFSENDIASIISRQEEVDAVHVVLCKNCKYAREPQKNCREEACACEGVLVCENGADTVFEEEIGWKFVNDDFFCADGRQKDGESDGKSDGNC